MESNSHWSPKEVRKTLLVLIGAGIIFSGIYLTANGLNTKGSFDFKSDLLSGKLESGNVGLFVILFGCLFLLISNIKSVTEMLGLIKKENVLVVAFIIIMAMAAILAHLFKTYVIFFFPLVFFGTAIITYLVKKNN